MIVLHHRGTEVSQRTTEQGTNVLREGKRNRVVIALVGLWVVFTVTLAGWWLIFGLRQLDLLNRLNLEAQLPCIVITRCCYGKAAF